MRKQTARDLIARSERAVCGLQERALTVRKENVTEAKRKLRARGMFIVGTSENGGGSRIIWFTPAVGL